MIEMVADDHGVVKEVGIFKDVLFMSELVS